MKILTIVGARPQFIKASTLSNAIRSIRKNNSILISDLIVHTGQHFDKFMSDTFFNELNIPKPKYNLGIGGGTHGENTGRMIEGIEKILFKEMPKIVIVYGDTDSTLAGAIATSKLKIPLIHIEAGLRSFNKDMPEEINRVLTDHLSTLNFAPTNKAVENLIREGIEKNRIIKTGDVMVDAAKNLENNSYNKNNFLEGLGVKNKQFILATIHRAENTDNPDRFSMILKSLSNQKLPIIFPIHPRTLSKINEFSLQPLLSNMKIIDPIGYLDMIILERNAKLIITDSGGVQKESYLHNTPSVILRTETEWEELLNSGWSILGNPENLLSINKSINTQLLFDTNSPKPDFYGDGKSAPKILNHLLKNFN